MKSTGGVRASVFSLSILFGAGGVTVAEYIPNIITEGAGFLIGFVVGFVFLSFLTYYVYSRPALPKLDIGEESDAVRELFAQLSIELMKTKRGRTEWK